jgi:delta24-sterol reductase
MSLLNSTQGEAIRNYCHDNHLIQDMLVPLYKVGEALEFVHREMDVYIVASFLFNIYFNSSTDMH